MSFPKAKIHRFNEEMTCAPPPGKYDPKFDTKVKGVVIEKSKRFVDPKVSSASSAESIESIGKSSSNLSVLPVFRTPQLKKSYMKTPKSVPVNSMTGSGVNARRNLEIETTVNNDLNQVKVENHNLSLQLNEKNKEIKRLNDELDKLQMSISEEQIKINEERKIAQCFHNEEIQNLNDEIDSLKFKINDEREKHSFELEKILSEIESRIEAMKLADNDVIEDLKKDFDIHRMEVEVDFKMKLNDICEEMKAQMEEMSKNVKNSVSRVIEYEKEFQKKTNDFEKVNEETQMKLEKALNDLATIAALKDELQKTDDEKKMALEESQNKINNLEAQLSGLVVELARSKQSCKTFHITTLEHRKTIEALSKRLFESESEVERLNSVQSDLETQKQLLEGKAENLIMEIINLRESMKYLESEIIREVEDIKTQLTAKVDIYRIKAAEETKTLLGTVEEKQRTIDMLVTEIDYYRSRLNETEGYINDVKGKSEQYNTEISQLKIKLSEVEEEFAEKMGVQKNVYSILDDNYREKCELINKLQNLKLDQEHHIHELVQKLDHQSECAQRATTQINHLTTDNISKEKQIESLISKLDSSSECVKTMSKHVENTVAELNSKDQQINALHQELDIKLAALNTITNENDDLKYKLEQKMQYINDLDKEIRETHKDNAKYVDELISEIVLEKERVTELNSTVEQIEDEKIKLEEDIKQLQTENEESVMKCLDYEEKLQKLYEDVNSEKTNSLRLTQILNEHKDNKRILEEKLEKDSIEKAQLIVEFSTKIDNLEEVIKKADEMVAVTEKENKELKLQMQAAQEYINNLEITNEETKVKVEELNDRVEEMSSELFNRSKEMEKLQTDVDMSKFEEAVSSLKEEIVLLCDNIDCKEREVNELLEMKNTLKDELVQSTEKYENQIRELKAQIMNEHEKNKELNNLYVKMENRKNEYKLYSSKITEEVEQLKEDFKTLKDERSKLENEKKQMEIMIGPFMKQLRDCEDERNLLASKKGAIEEELHALERKYAQSLGHQNLKQKIHYVSRLKEENIQYKQTIDQLTTENIRLKNKCKDLELASRENSSPKTGKKSLNRERVHSPNVLKDRNHQ